MSPSPQSELVINGDYYTGQNSHRQSAELRPGGAGILLKTTTEERALAWQDLKISPRIGNTPRYLHLPDDGVFETTDNDGVDQLSRQCSGNGFARLVHRLERHLGLILIAVLVTAAVTGLTLTYGVPWASRVIAYTLPDTVAQTVGETALHSLDDTWFEPSTLSDGRQQALLNHFAPYLGQVGGQQLRVEFRDAPVIGANALALPDGTLVFTDDLVNLAEQDDELVAILAHEIGHIEYRHGMQGMVQSSLLFWVLVMMTGDLSAFSDPTIALPAFLMSMSYSRDMEQQADDYALQTMLSHNLNPMLFATIMARLTEEDISTQEHGESENNGYLLELVLSSHPISRERIARFREASESHFNAGN
ncbi:M48 family metallopeptidase [Marinobacter salinisoli]|uniref:M48 family metallopeptidase n=1 Tax=Marinobacter salinisoli TaxID=2769486 RepID=A0ABX7MS37_9GAMM|nr:M48 family metallopeptidase [Marinobacter salinisoli]QSP95175.1 M48 family metallopeptidase [Marinobacter salinisoli]